MLTRVDVLSENPFYLKVRDAQPTDSIIIEKIEGLNPPDIDLFLGDYARDGGFYSGRRVAKRNIVLSLVINPNYKNNETVSGLREMLVRAFVDPTVRGNDVTLILKDDVKPDRFITGYTEKFGDDIFSEDTAPQISMLCPNPYILDVAETIIPASGPRVPFQYFGSAETGAELDLIFTTNSSDLWISLNDDSFMALNYAFLSGDQLHINTIRGERSIKLVRGSTTTDILYSLSNTSEWLELHKADSVLEVYGLTAGVEPRRTVANISELRFRGAHWGI